MREYIQALLLESGALSTEDILLRILASAAFGAAIYLSYWYTHTGTTYSKKFNVSLVTLAILTGTVMTVIGNNVALSLGMVGALSIIRFRTAIKDSRDTTYIFWAIIVGICCGVGDYMVAGIGSAAVFVVLLLLGRVRNENRMLLIIRGSKGKTTEVEGTVFRQFGGKAVLKVKNTTADSCEFIYEMDRKTYALAQTGEADIFEHLYALSGIEYVNLVAQSDEITG